MTLKIFALKTVKNLGIVKEAIALTPAISVLATGAILSAPTASASLAVSPDTLPLSVVGTAGGRVAIPQGIVPAGQGRPQKSCLGFASLEANHRLDLNTVPSSLTITVNSFSSDVDTTLAVKTPEGQWLCGDDISATNTDAAVTISSPSAGSYEVWVGTFDGGYADYELSLN
ncbi:MAG: hypothetical protein AAF685_02390 [Cyanobacteria bacterium P01_C01_bin.89]